MQVDKIDSDLKHALNEFEESKAKAQRTYIIVRKSDVVRLATVIMAVFRQWCCLLAHR